MIKQITKSFIIYLNDKFEILFAQCRKTGKFVQKALARLELETKEYADVYGSMIGLFICVMAIINAIVYLSCDFSLMEYFTSNGLMTLTLCNYILFHKLQHSQA